MHKEDTASKKLQYLDLVSEIRRQTLELDGRVDFSEAEVGRPGEEQINEDKILVFGDA